MPEQQAPKKIRQKALGDYLEVMSKSVFQSGMSWKVVEVKWLGTQKAFRNFNAKKVASMTTRDIDKLVKDLRVIRNRRKLEAVVGNARQIIELDADHGSFKKYLRSKSGFEDRIKMLRKDFKFLGTTGAYHFLYVVGEKVPSHSECQKRLDKL